MDSQKPLNEYDLEKLIVKVLEKNKLNQKLQKSIYNNFISDKIEVKPKEKGWRNSDEV